MSTTGKYETTSVAGEEASAFVPFPLPPAKAVGTLVDAGVLRETPGRKRDRVFAYAKYLEILGSGTKL